jgi:calcium/calmodulin-dependent protein kinase (CaM kinase) II
MTTDIGAELLSLNQRLLDSITRADWQTYEELCDPSLSAFEPEAAGQLVEGLPFHRFYFDLGGIKGPHQTTMAAPKVRLLGDTAIVTYVRLTQRLNSAGAMITTSCEETRVWQRQDSRWRLVHFHRSLPSAGSV